MANILTNEEICEIGGFGDVIWLECYFDGNTSLEPFMTDISPYQNPVIINARCTIISSFPSEIHENIICSFNSAWKNKRYRWWDSRPSIEERKNNEGWIAINEG